MEKMCEKAVEKKPWSLKFVPDGHKSLGMCNEVVQEGSYLVEYVPDWSILQGHLKILHDYKGLCNNYFYDCVIGWCMSEDKKRHWK